MSRPATAARRATHAGRAAPRPLRPVPGPRRVSGPTRTRPAAATTAPGILVGAAGLARTLPDSRALDRLIRGRTWVAVIAVALIGIVAMQVHMLGLNAGIGRAVEKTSTLEQQNTALRLEVSRLELRRPDRRGGPAARARHAERRRGPLHGRPRDRRHARRAQTMKPADPDLAAQAKAAVEAGVGTGAIALAPESAEKAPGERPPAPADRRSGGDAPRRRRAARSRDDARSSRSSRPSRRQQQQPPSHRRPRRRPSSNSSPCSRRRPRPSRSSRPHGGDAGRRRRRDAGRLGPVALTQRRIGLLFAVFLVLLGIAVLRAGWVGLVSADTPQATPPRRSRSPTSRSPRSAARSPTAPAPSSRCPSPRATSARRRTSSRTRRARPRSSPRSSASRRASCCTSSPSAAASSTSRASCPQGAPRRSASSTIAGVDLTPTSRREYPRDWLGVAGARHREVRRHRRRGPGVQPGEDCCTARTASGGSCATRSASRSRSGTRPR